MTVDWGLAFSVGSFILLAIMTAVRWIGSREHADSDLAEKLKEYKIQSSADLAERKKGLDRELNRIDREINRLDREIINIINRERDLANAQQNDRVAIAVLRARLEGKSDE